MVLTSLECVRSMVSSSTTLAFARVFRVAFTAGLALTLGEGAEEIGLGLSPSFRSRLCKEQTA